MHKTEPEIRNKFGEKLDTWVETPEGKVSANVIMVHGFGTDKGETAGYFDDVSKALVGDSFRVIRFDFSGYGKSEGSQAEACYSKHIHDLSEVIDFVKNSFQEPVHIFAQSMGCFVTALLSPKGINKTIMTGIPNSDPNFLIKRFVERFGSRPGAKLDMDGVSLLPRSTGKIQQIGSQFWQDIRALNPAEIVKSYSEKTELLIIHWQQDEIIGSDYLKEYDLLPTLKFMYLPGNHSVTNLDDRKNFLKIMLTFFK